MYEELVGKEVVSDADFWASRRTRNLLDAAKAKQGAGQRLGIANAMMAEVKPTSDGRSNTVKFTLTSEMMHQIFAEKPAVRQVGHAERASCCGWVELAAVVFTAASRSVES
jgi:transcription initiation factor TFIIH subunit 1